MNIIKNKKGFTLIELVIVLAIAALILVGVLLAVQGAQRSRRDTQRKNDAGTIGTYLEQAASNHNGAYPNVAGGLSAALFQTDYVDLITDPDAGHYTASFTGAYNTCTTNPASDTVNIAYSGTHWSVCMYQESGDPFSDHS